MKAQFTDDGWDDYLYWCKHDTGVHARLNELIENVRRTPFQGLGKPEPLKGQLTGYWSRRLTGEHRLLYSVEGRGNAQCVTIIQCRFHY